GAFVGLGAYASVWASEGRSFAWGLLAAVVLSAAVALAFAVLVVRSDHFYFAIATLAFSHIALIVFRELESFTAPGGEIVGIPKPDLFGHRFASGQALALLLGAFLLLALLLTALAERSPPRRAAVAVSDNRPAAATGWGAVRRRRRRRVPVRPHVRLHQHRVLRARARHRHLPRRAAGRRRVDVGARARRGLRRVGAGAAAVRGGVPGADLRRPAGRGRRRLPRRP